LRNNVDDLGFITHLIHVVSQTENIDPQHVYLTGISNEAAMAYRNACEGTYPLATIGAVAGSFSFSC
jgi:polyhydroxybutyrate depolymerase